MRAHRGAARPAGIRRTERLGRPNQEGDAVKGTVEGRGKTGGGGEQESVGRTAADHRAFVNGVLWVLRSGARWSDLPERYGKHKSVHKRFSRWATSGVWDRVFRILAQDKSDQCLMIDSTIVRAHQQAATGRKKEGPDQALGRSRGGLTTKIHLLCNELGKPIDFLLTGGQVADCTTEFAASVCRSRGCLCNREELAASETLGTDRNLGRRRILAFGVRCNRGAALAFWQRFEDELGVRNALAICRWIGTVPAGT